MSISTLGEGYGADELVRLMNRNGITNYRYRSAARSLHAASTAVANPASGDPKADRP